MSILGYTSRGGLWAFKKRNKDFPQGFKRGDVSSARIYSVSELKEFFERKGFEVVFKDQVPELTKQERAEYEKLKKFKADYDEAEFIRSSIDSSAVTNGYTNLNGAFG